MLSPRKTMSNNTAPHTVEQHTLCAASNCSTTSATLTSSTKSMNETSLVGYGTTIDEAIDILNRALMFHYNHDLELCKSRGHHFTDLRGRIWHLKRQKQYGMYKVYLC
jgi:hypothetical protein